MGSSRTGANLATFCLGGFDGSVESFIAQSFILNLKTVLFLL